MRVISVRENPEYKDKIIACLQARWESVRPVVYEDSVNHTIGSENPLPQWYVLEHEGEAIGCAGLITNDFISRMDLYPWLCALYVDENYRGNSYGKFLIDRAMYDARVGGFKNMYLCTDHIGYYEKYGFRYIGTGYHPWDDESRIYEITL